MSGQLGSQLALPPVAFGEDKRIFTSPHPSILNILEDFVAEKERLEQSQRAFLNILEDIDLERGKVAAAYKRIETVNGELQGFVYAASHDLKAPLRVIANAANWLEEDLREHLTDETRDNIDLLRGRIKRMDKLLDDLLEYSRIGRTTDARFLETVAGDVLVDDILALISPPPGFEVTLSPGFGDLRVRRMPLQQILMNLIGNAIKHHDKKSGRIELTVQDRRSHFAFAVKDDGPGIPAQFHNQIFKMFQTLKPRDQVEGSGMGFAMVRKNIELFGGALKLKSSEGNGSCFCFTWPKHQHETRGENP
jgi:signal transduction histidine kinase